MAAVNICRDLGAQKNKVCHCFHSFTIYLPQSDGTRCHDLSFLNNWVLSQLFHSPLSLSSRGSLVLHFLFWQLPSYLDALNCDVGEDSWESLGLQGAQTSQSYRKSVLNIHWKDRCWSWSSNTLATWCDELTHWKRPWCWERLKAGGEGDDRGWDGWMASSTQWTWVWASSRRWWRAEKPGVMQSMGSQRDTSEWMNWTNWTCPLKGDWSLCSILCCSHSGTWFDSLE